MSIIPPNRLLRRLTEGHLAVGTMISEIRQPAVAQALVNAGFDWAIIDNEHGVFSNETIAELGRSCRWLGLTPIVRVPVLAYEQIAHALDGGAQGVTLSVRDRSPEPGASRAASWRDPSVGSLLAPG